MTDNAKLIEAIERLDRSTARLMATGNHTVITVSGSNWIAALAAVIAIGCAFYAASVKGDMRAESLDRRAEDRWVRENLSAIRAYIHTGKLKPVDERKEAK
jgi:hypothetical protein